MKLLKKSYFQPRSLRLGGIFASVILTGAAASEAAIIFASGRNLGDNSYAKGAYYYSIDTATGVATPISPPLSSNGVNGLSASGSQLVGFQNGTHGVVNPYTGAFTPSGTTNGLNLTGYEVMGGYGYGVPAAGSDFRLQRIDLITSNSSGVGTGSPIVEAMNSFYGTATTNTPNILSMASLGSTLYGVNSTNGKFNLVEINATTGAATFLGVPNAVALSGTPGARYTGFTSLTGVDENGDGVHDTLYGNINYYDPDGFPAPLPEQDYGALVRYDVTNGTWSLVGTNPGVIFFGFGSPIPEPSTAGLALLGLAAAFRRRRN